jgi:type III secretion system low calcium response chaperone LcrH/SycD
MMKFEELLKEIGRKRQEVSPFPDDYDAFVADFIPNKLLQKETFQKVFDVSEEKMEEIYQEAYFLYQKGEYEVASHVFRGLVILNPFRPPYWLGLGGSLQLSGEYEKALHAYGVLVHLSPDDPAPHQHAYECYTALGNQEDAELALFEAKQLQEALRC